MLRIALALGSLALGATGAGAETWRVLEGAPSGMTNVWQVDISGDNVLARAGALGRNSADTAIPVSGSIIQGEYRLSSPPISTVPACSFIGKPENANRIAGTSSCGGQLRVWLVERM